jgi:hypothetical protein
LHVPYRANTKPLDVKDYNVQARDSSSNPS